MCASVILHGEVLNRVITFVIGVKVFKGM